MSTKDNDSNRGYYTSGHYQTPQARLINFISNDHECNILLSYDLSKEGFITFKVDIISKKNALLSRTSP